MVSKKHNRLDDLVEALEIKHELQPLLDSEGGYKRFEDSVLACLQAYTTSPRVRRWQRDKPFSRRLKLRDGYVSVTNFSQAVSYFNRYFGFGRKPQNYDVIARGTKVGPGRISHNVHFVVEVLRQHHKQDIWYGSL